MNTKKTDIKEIKQGEKKICDICGKKIWFFQKNYSLKTLDMNLDLVHKRCDDVYEALQKQFLLISIKGYRRYTKEQILDFLKNEKGKY